LWIDGKKLATSSLRAHAPQELHQAVARRERPLARPAGKGVVDEERLEDTLLLRHQQVVDDPVAEVRREDLARLRAAGDEADRGSRAVAVGAELLLEREQVRFGVRLEGERIARVPLVAAAAAVLPPQLAERIEIRADHEPPRTARAKLVLLLLSLFTFPSLKFTFHAFVGLFALVLDDQ